MAQPQVQISDEALRVLRLLTEKAMDGYRLLDRSGLEPEALCEVGGELVAKSLIAVKGELRPDYVGDAYFWVPPNAQSYARFLVQQLRSSA